MKSAHGGLGIEFDEGRVMFPAFVNLHVHLGENQFKGIRGDNWSLMKYIRHTERANACLTSPERERLWQQSAAEVLHDLMSLGVCGLCAARASSSERALGFKVLSGYPVMRTVKLAGFLNAGLAGYLKYRERYESGKCKVGVFLHSLYANDGAALELVSRCLDVGAEFVTVHVAEDEESEAMERRMYGRSAIAELDARGLLTEKTILVHGGYVTENDWEKIASRHSSLVVCPISNRFLGTRIPDVKKVSELGVKWYVGTDGLATGRSLSLIDQVRELKSVFGDLEDKDIFRAVTSWPDFVGWQTEDRLCAYGRFANEDEFLAELFAGRMEVKRCMF